jgi:hypothetical protein
MLGVDRSKSERSFYFLSIAWSELVVASLHRRFSLAVATLLLRGLLWNLEMAR